jgi:hypothetical protein
MVMSALRLDSVEPFNARSLLRRLVFLLSFAPRLLHFQAPDQMVRHSLSKKTLQKP